MEKTPFSHSIGYKNENMLDGSLLLFIPSHKTCPSSSYILPTSSPIKQIMDDFRIGGDLMPIFEHEDTFREVPPSYRFDQTYSSYLRQSAQLTHGRRQTT